MATNQRGNTGRKTNASSRSTTTSRSKSASSRTRTSAAAGARRVQEEELDYTLRSEIVVIAVVALTIFLFLCNFGVCGALGNAVSSVLFGLFGFTAYVAPLVMLASVVVGIANFGSSASKRKIISGLVIFLLVGIIADLVTGRPQSLTSYDIKTIYSEASTGRNGGGFFAGSLAYLFYKYLSLAGTILLLLLIGIAALVVFTQHSFVKGLKIGGMRILDRTRMEADNYREYAEKRRVRMQQRRAQIEEQRRLAIEQKEDEKILRMEKKVAGVSLDTALNKEEEEREERPRLSFKRDEAEDLRLRLEETAAGKNIFIPDEEEFHDDIHEITLKSEAEEENYFEDYGNEASSGFISGNEAGREAAFDKTDSYEIAGVPSYEEPEPVVNRQEPRIHIMSEAEKMSETVGLRNVDDYMIRMPQKDQKEPEPEPEYSGYSQQDEYDEYNDNGLRELGPDFEEVRVKQFVSHENDAYEEPLEDGQNNAYSGGASYENDYDTVESLSYSDADEYSDALAAPYSKGGSYNEHVSAAEPEQSNSSSDTSLQRLVARATAQAEEEDILPDVPVHAEHLGNGKNGDYVIHAQDHISMSRSADTSINGAAPSKTNNSPGPHTTSPGMEKSIEEHQKAIHKDYVFPPVDLLEKGKINKNTDSERQLKETAAKLQRTLESFGVRATVTEISQGPSVTRFELQPEAGVRVNKIVGLSDDIKMNLAASDIRIEAPIPGKAAVGIEVPNKENQAVAFRDLLESREFQEFGSKLVFAVGKDIGGKVVVADIAKMPHLLIAGSTGSGKSVCINTIIMSIIYKAKPEEVQMIMIDPKIVELSIYNGIPHLMIPVVTDPKKAAAALNWAVGEMTDRYKKFAECGVRDLKGYNAKAAAGDNPSMKVLPQIVVIVDELADLMMVSANEVEEAICRLAQLARAAGIHLIIATQRPSVDVITGLIKANMPSRVAFAVSSGVDSRTILDVTGAEKLLGKGDMLFYPQGYTKPARIQGAFVSDKEVQAVTDFLRGQDLGSAYGSEIEQKIQNMQSQAGGGSSSSGDSGSGQDEYFVQAGNIIIEKDKASIGMLQRVFKIGFNRAARIMDQLCEAGVVGDEEGTKPRKVLMTKAQFDELVNGGE